MTLETFAIITCEIGWDPDECEADVPPDDAAIKRHIAATVESALDGNAELMVYGRVKVELS